MTNLKEALRALNGDTYTYPTARDDVRDMYVQVGLFEARAWQVKTGMAVHLMDDEVAAGRTRKQAAANAAEILGERPLAVRKYADINDKILAHGEVKYADLNMYEQGYFNLAVKHDGALGKSAFELIEYFNERCSELGKYSVAQAREDLGLVVDDPVKKLLRCIRTISACEESELDGMKPAIQREAGSDVSQAVSVLQSLISEAPEAEGKSPDAPSPALH